LRIARAGDFGSNCLENTGVGRLGARGERTLPVQRLVACAQIALDDYDVHYLRMSVADLAKKLAVSRATIGNRIKRLEQSGVIVGYTVRLRPDAQPQEIRAWMSIAAEGDRTQEVGRTLLREPAVTSLHDTNGRLAR
jgi:biotin operon repressor